MPARPAPDTRVLPAYGEGAVIVLHEWEQVTTALTPEEWRSVQALNAQIGEVLLVTPDSVPGRVTLKASHYVGQVRLPSGRQIEIRPKVSVGVLGALMARAGLFGKFLPSLVTTATTSTDGSLIDWLRRVADLFLEQVEAILAGGLLIGFTVRDEDSTLVRGKLDLRHALYHAPHLRQRGTVPDTTVDVVENQLVRQACEHVRRHALADAVRVDAMMRRLGAISDLRDPLPHFAQLTFTRLNERYRPALALAEYLLRLETITGHGGTDAFPSVLINMQHLFERVVINSLTTADRQWRVMDQQATTLDRDGLVTVRPDALVVPASGQRVVVDAKYTRAPSNADLYQALAYCHALRAQRAVLVYSGALPTTTYRIAPFIPSSPNPSTPASADGTVQRDDHPDDQLVIVMIGLELSGSGTMMGAAIQDFITSIHVLTLPPA